MELMQAKKLFSPPDKIDGTKLHLINMANKSFETLAMDLVELCPKSEHLDEVIHEINKARLLFNHSIEIMKTGKEKPAPIEAPKAPKAEKPKKEKKQVLATADVETSNQQEINDEVDSEEEIEGFE